MIDDASYSARVRGRVLHLTYREFELLKCLAQHAGRVLTRAQLLQEVWGYDYFGGTRTVDVHVRRLRAKLGPEHDSMIGTVRNVGYRFVAPPARSRARVDVGAAQVTPDRHGHRGHARGADAGGEQAVLRLVELSEDNDGITPLSEQAILRVRHANTRPIHLVARGQRPIGEDDRDEVVGYLILEPGVDERAGDLVAELVVHPEHRHEGIGQALLEAALAEAERRPRCRHDVDLGAR